LVALFTCLNNQAAILKKRSLLRGQNLTETAVEDSAPERSGIWKELSYPSLWTLLRDSSKDNQDSSQTKTKSPPGFEALVNEVGKASPHSTLLVFGDNRGLVVSDMARVLPEQATIVSVLKSELDLKEHNKHNRRDRVVTAISELSLAMSEELKASLFWSQYVVVLNASSLLKGLVPKEAERVLANLALVAEHLVVHLSLTDRSLKAWQNDAHALLNAVISRAGLKSASVLDVDAEAGLFMILTSEVTRPVSPLGKEGPVLSLKYNVAQKNRLPTRFPVLVCLPKDEEGNGGKALPLDLFGVSLQVLNLLHVSHFSRRQLFERFSKPVLTRFISLQPREGAAEVSLSNFAKSAFLFSSWVTNETMSNASDLNALDIWICGSKLVFDSSISKAGKNKKDAISVVGTSRKLLAIDQEVRGKKKKCNLFFI
jgi:hypothetical protein